MRQAIIAALTLLAGLTATSAASRNLVVNGGFETGDFSGWSQFGDTSYNAVSPAFSGIPAPEGKFLASFGPVYDFGGIRQTIRTKAGASYDLSYLLGSLPGEPTEYIVSFDGTVYFDEMASGAFPVQPRHLPVIASGTTAVVEFSFYDPASYFVLDDVAVAATAVPEPQSWALLTAGFAGVGAILRRRPRIAA